MLDFPVTCCLGPSIARHVGTQEGQGPLGPGIACNRWREGQGRRSDLLYSTNVALLFTFWFCLPDVSSAAFSLCPSYPTTKVNIKVCC